MTEPEGGDPAGSLAIGNDDYVVTDDGTGPGPLTTPGPLHVETGYRVAAGRAPASLPP